MCSSAGKSVPSLHILAKQKGSAGHVGRKRGKKAFGREQHMHNIFVFWNINNY